MQKLLAVLLLVPVFFLSACSSTSPRDDATMAHQGSADINNATLDIDIGKNPGSSSVAISNKAEQHAQKETDVWKRIEPGQFTCGGLF